jgi:NTE family protein
VPHGRTPFEQIALLLQGGGALGAYQAGVWALAEADLHPDWVAGSRSAPSIRQSLPAIRRSAASMRCANSGRWSVLRHSACPISGASSSDDIQRQLLNQTRAMNILLFGAPNFFCAAHAAADDLAAGWSGQSELLR